MTKSYVKTRKILTSLTSDASGDVSAEEYVGGIVYMQKCYAATSGSHVTVKELIEQPGEITITGDTIFDRVVSGNVTHIPVVNVTDITGSTLTGAGFAEHPVADAVVITVASGGNAKPVNLYHYLGG